MIHLRNRSTGVAVTVSDATAARLGREWEPLDSGAPAPKTPARRKAAPAKK